MSPRISSPVRTPSTTRPTCSATWRATRSLSPVTTLSATPSRPSWAIVSSTPSLGGSLNRIRPSKTRSRSTRSGSTRRPCAPRPGVPSSSGVSAREPTATSRNPSAEAPSTRRASRSCSAASIGRAVWSSRTWLDRCRTASGAPFVTRSGGSLVGLDDDAEQPAREVVGKLGELAIGREIRRLRRVGEDGRVERVREARSGSGCSGRRARARAPPRSHRLDRCPPRGRRPACRS